MPGAPFQRNAVAEKAFHVSWDQFHRDGRALGNPVRGLLRPFGIRLPSRVLRAFFARWSEEVRRRGG